ncbi:MAG: hypothetical protein JNL79_39940 [Myxococcales bacterium]|nr:hypothetical protein [Myxococcales bacterium]
MTLHPCAHCRRHVALDSQRCPFCSGATPTAGATPRARPSRRLPRNAMMLVASSALVVGCGESVPLYGAPAYDTGAADTATDAPTDTGTKDTGASDTGASDSGASDTGLLDTGGVGNLYGAPADVGAD